jgi:hypothetical protein
MKRTLILLTLLPTLCAADPCQNPRRSVSNGLVDLTPLFVWWSNATTFAEQSREWQKTNSPPPRPGPAWMRVKVIEVISHSVVSWVVIADIEERPGSERTAKVVLWHPPEAQYTRWVSLKQQSGQAVSYANTQSSSAAFKSDWAGKYNEDGNNLSGRAAAFKSGARSHTELPASRPVEPFSRPVEKKCLHGKDGQYGCSRRTCQDRAKIHMRTILTHDRRQTRIRTIHTGCFRST